MLGFREARNVVLLSFDLDNIFGYQLIHVGGSMLFSGILYLIIILVAQNAGGWDRTRVLR